VGLGLGIVDPFLKTNVMTSQEFYIFIYPKAITSLRHVWTHPLVSDEVPEASYANEHEAWMHNFCKEIGATYDEVMNGAEDYQEYGEYLNHGQRFDGVWVSEEFWDHWEALTGKKVTRDKDNFFSCSC
jgi:hypothetical protein